jgi:hypothetical protein
MIRGHSIFMELGMAEYVARENPVINAKLSAEVLATIIQIMCCIRSIVHSAGFTHFKPYGKIVSVSD